MAETMGGQQNLSGNGRRYETEILCTEHVPLPLGCRSARGTSAGIHRFGHLRPLQTTARLQRTEPYGLRRLRLARRAVCHSNWPTPCNYYRQQYQPLSRTARQDRLLVRLEPRARYAPATPNTTTGHNGLSSRCSRATTTTSCRKHSPSPNW